MRRAALCALSLLAACGGTDQTITADEAKSALPQSSQVQMDVTKMPGGSGSSALGASASAQVQTSGAAVMTYLYAVAVNASVGLFLDRIRDVVVAVPPTQCAGDTCTWGPGSYPLELNDWKLTVTKQDVGHYAWALAGQPKSNPSIGFVTIASGNAFPSGTPRVGHGDFVVDADAAARLDRFFATSPGTGKVQVTSYDNRNPAQRALSVQFLGTADQQHVGQTVNAAYAYTDAVGGPGDLQLAVRNLSSGDTASAHSRWAATGAGRCDLRASSGGAASTLSQCWDTAANHLNVLYQASSPAQATDGGVEGACAYAPAAYATLSAP